MKSGFRMDRLAAVLVMGAAAVAMAVPAMAQEERPPFMENMGQFAAGQAMPNFAVQVADGKPARMYDFISGKTTLVALWDAGRGPGDETLQWLERLAGDYRAQGVTVLGIACWAARGDFEQWMTTHRGKVSFPVVFDPSGAAPAIAKAYDDLTPEEKGRYQFQTRQYLTSTIMGQLLRNGGMMPLPMLLVVDKEGRMLGWTGGMGDRAVQGIGNLLARAEVRLNEKDLPKKVWSREETRPPSPAGGEGVREVPVKMLAAGADAPDFTTMDLDGKPVKLSDYRGKVIVLDFWATWCGPCMAAMPEVSEVAKKYKDQGVVVLAACTADSRSAFDKWVPANQPKYPDVLFTHDPLERKPERVAFKLYGVAGIPTQFVIGRDGKVMEVVVGYSKGEVILEGALAKAGVKVDPAIVAKAAQDLKDRDTLARAASGEPMTVKESGPGK